MKVQRLTIFILLFLMPGFVFGQNLVVQNNQVDKLVVGNDSLRIYEVYPTLKTQPELHRYQTENESVLLIQFDAKNNLYINIFEGKIVRFTAVGSRFITDEGIQTGTTLSILKKMYAGFKILPAGEDGLPYFITRRRIAFELSGVLINMTNEPCIGDLVDPFPNTLQVASIIIW